jgi:hypothetical protein
MLKRNNNDFRKSDKKIYTEIHHITPKSIGGTDDDSNLVILLPEEHLFAHKLRYKAYKDRCDFIAVRISINGILNHKRYKNIPILISKKINSAYSWMKQNSAEFRIVNGWQTAEGRDKISKSRKNMLVVKCVKSGEILGSFDKNHPKILSGEWVHHSKGKHKFYNKITGEKIYCYVDDQRLLSGEWTGLNYDVSGEKNTNYSGISDEEIYDFYLTVNQIIKHKYNSKVLVSIAFVKKVWDKKFNTRPFPNLAGGLRSGFRFNGDIHTNLYEKVSLLLDMEYFKYSKLTRKINIEELINDID